MTSRRVPVDFDDYLALNGPVDSGPGVKCDGCGAPAIASDGFSDYCEACWRGIHAFEVAEEDLARGVIGAAVREALDGGAGPDLVYRAFRLALDEAVA